MESTSYHRRDTNVRCRGPASTPGPKFAARPRRPSVISCQSSTPAAGASMASSCRRVGMCGAPDADGQARSAHPSSCISKDARLRGSILKLSRPTYCSFQNSRIHTSSKLLSSLLSSESDDIDPDEAREPASSVLEAITANPPSSKTPNLHGAGPAP